MHLFTKSIAKKSNQKIIALVLRPVTVLKGFGCVAHPVKLDVGEPLGLLGVSVSHHRNVIDVTELLEVFSYLGFLGVLQKKIWPKIIAAAFSSLFFIPDAAAGSQ